MSEIEEAEAIALLPEPPEAPEPKSFGEAMFLVQAIIERPKFDTIGQVGKRTYKYASLGACQDVVKDACLPVGMSFWYDIVPFGPDGTESAVVTVVSFNGEERKLFPVKFNPSENMQDEGRDITYAKRYSLSGAFALVAEEDTDAAQSPQSANNRNNASKPESNNNRTANAKSGTSGAKSGRFDKITALKAKAIEVGIKEEGIKEHINATYKKDLRDFTKEEIASFEAYLEKLIADKQSLQANQG